MRGPVGVHMERTGVFPACHRPGGPSAAVGRLTCEMGDGEERRGGRVQQTVFHPEKDGQCG